MRSYEVVVAIATVNAGANNELDLGADCYVGDFVVKSCHADGTHAAFRGKLSTAALPADPAAATDQLMCVEGCECIPGTRIAIAGSGQTLGLGRYLKFFGLSNNTLITVSRRMPAV
jgi:hypothetical protein